MLNLNLAIVKLESAQTNHLFISKSPRESEINLDIELDQVEVKSAVGAGLKGT